MVNGVKASVIEFKFDVMGFEEVMGKYDMVMCIDVMIYYLKDCVDGMINYLVSLSSKKFIIFFASKTLAYFILKRVGELFSGLFKVICVYFYDEVDVEIVFKVVGFKVKCCEMIVMFFYFFCFFECERV